jgi:hypothetical protein
MYLSRSLVLPLLELSIREQRVLNAIYDHVDRTERVSHRLAVFDFGTTNPNTRDRFQNNVYAYAYDHLNTKTNLADPRVIAFNVDSFLSLEASGVTFNAVELTDLNFRATKYDYRHCEFAIVPERGWYK